MNRPASLVSLLAAAFLLPAASSFQVDARSGAASAVSASAPRPAAPQSSQSGVWALVGARIVDGSGNEPFEGTIVVRDGRIAEAGRSVQPPADARIVDAKGRTVTTGLVDLHVVLPPGASEDQIARALGAYTYAGVTTVAISGIEPSAFDTVREKLHSHGVIAPRLVAARADGASAVAPGLARAAQSAQRKPTALLGEMVSPARFQQAQAANDAALSASGASSTGTSAAAGSGTSTAGSAPGAAAGGATTAGAATSGATSTGSASGASVAPSATLGSGAGDGAKWQAALERFKTLRASNARIAVASGAGAADGTNLPHGWTTLLETRLLGEAGLTPLQAVTAATSGGAWALGLQSDRAFIAVGQRADLVVFHGQPTSTLADVEKIERVFLGGQEIDRAALRTFLTRDDPAPAAAPTETTAGATANAATASGAAAPTRGAAGRKGRRGKADPASTTGANAANTTSPSSTSGANTGAVAAGAAPGSGVAAGAPTTTTGTPGSAGTAGRAAVSGSSASAPAETSAGAAAASAPLAGVALESPLIDDFETNGSRANLGPAWQTGGDESTPPHMIIAGRVVRGLRDHALHLTARMGDASQPYAAVNVRIAGENGRPADVSRFRGLRFDARGEGRYRIVFITRGVTDGHYHVSYFSGSPNWTPVSIPFSSIAQNGNGSAKQVRWTGHDLIEISFQVARDPGQMGWLELDNVRFY